MKKVLFVLAASAFFVACNDSSTDTETTTDSTMIYSDSTMMAPPMADTTMADTSHMMMTDTTGVQ